MAKPERAYDVIPIVESPTKGLRPGPRLATGLDAKSALKVAVRNARNIDADGPRVVRVHVVVEGFGAYDPVAMCTTGDFRGHRERVETVRERERRLAFDRRGGVSRAVRCDIPSPAFKKAVAGKARKKRRR